MLVVKLAQGMFFFFVLHIVKCSLHVQTFELMVDLIGSDD